MNPHELCVFSLCSCLQTACNFISQYSECAREELIMWIFSIFILVLSGHVDEHESMLRLSTLTESCNLDWVESLICESPLNFQGKKSSDTP